ncbi:MAG: AMP-binding protein [Chitinivibrionales bacterium]|nr:AMP-binding protein [Chitinivibrionales bacterium]MBD3356479.1 AMP-binding protein [Chitinivibrionales bacterium]
MIEFDPVLVHEWLSRSAARTPDKTALIAEGRRIAYREIDEKCERCARALIELGVRRGDRVIVLLDNSIETVIAIYGILKAGGVFVVLEGSMKAGKLAYILSDAGGKVLVTHTDKFEVVKECKKTFSTLEYKTLWVDGAKGNSFGADEYEWDALLDKQRAVGPECRPRIIDVDLAALIYTSGSTGEPKGVMSTHHNMVSAARSIIQYIGNEPDDVILDVLPLSFDYGLYQVIMAFMFGGTVVLERSFTFMTSVLRRAATEGVTGLPVVPTAVAMLLKTKDFSRFDLSKLRYLTNTGAALPVGHIMKLRELLPHVKILSMFGLTECKRVCYLPFEEIDHRPASVGKAMPNCETRIVDNEGRDVAPNKNGELVVRGSNVMQGYWNAPDATSRSYRAGGYPADRLVYSGDIFRSDIDGYLYFVGRRDEMIKSRGERVSALEVESVLCSMQGVLEAAVVGVPDEILGQAVKAFVAAVPGARVTAAEVLRFCRRNLETFMIPKQVEVVRRLPRTPHGKVDKKLLVSVLATGGNNT